MPLLPFTSFFILKFISTRPRDSLTRCSQGPVTNRCTVMRPPFCCWRLNPLGVGGADGLVLQMILHLKIDLFLRLSF